MSAVPAAVRAPRWPWRWVLLDLAPLAGGALVLVLVLGGAWTLLRAGPPPWPALAALVLAALYARQLHRLSRASWDARGAAELPDAADPRAVRAHVRRLARDDARRFLPSVVLRVAAFLALLLALRLPAAVAIAVALAASLAIGCVQLTRQIAIVETFRDVAE